MKISTFFIVLSLFVLTISACAPAAPAASAAAPISTAAATIDIAFPDAANLRSQLAYGLIKLGGSSNAITSEQAKTLIPLWQAMLTLSGDETTASEELTAVQDQITQTLTPAQIQAIGAMKITNAELNTYYAQFGVSLPTPVPGVTKVPGSKANTHGSVILELVLRNYWPVGYRYLPGSPARIRFSLEQPKAASHDTKLDHRWTRPTNKRL